MQEERNSVVFNDELLLFIQFSPHNLDGIGKKTMEWFMGSIPEAIGKSRQNGLLFIVYIEGKSHPT